MIRLRNAVWVALLTASMGLVGGIFLHRAIARHRFAVRQEKTYPTSAGDVHWQYVTDTDGPALLDPGATQLEFNGRILYKAQRYFQDDKPFVDEIKVTDGTIDWQDGEYIYSLRINPIKERK